MTHPTELLPDYLSGDLSPQERRDLERHLETCETCRRELQGLERTLVTLIDQLPPMPVPSGSWQAIERRIGSGQRRWRWEPFAVAAGLILAAVSGVWGLSEQRTARQLRAEQRKVAGWLSRPDMRALPIDGGGERIGGVLLLGDGRALFVLDEYPPRGRAYQAWGRRDDEVVPLETTQRRILEVRYQDFERIGVSLEPPGGSSTPTEPLGTVPTSAAGEDGD